MDRRALAVVIMGSLWVSSSLPASERLPEFDALRVELVERAAVDQRARRARPVDVEMLARIDAGNTAWLKDVVAEHGWPKISEVGRDGAQAAWLLVQHADADPKFQTDVLATMLELLPAGEVIPQGIAFLWDRLNEPQRYGTQGRCAGPGDWRPREIEQPEAVDERRAEVGLRPMAEYVEFASSRLCSRAD